MSQVRQMFYLVNSKYYLSLNSASPVLIQVSHHPPTLATHTDGRGWTLWQEFTMTTKFRGRYLQIIPMGQFCFVCVCKYE